VIRNTKPILRYTASWIAVLGILTSTSLKAAPPESSEILRYSVSPVLCSCPDTEGLACIPEPQLFGLERAHRLMEVCVETLRNERAERKIEKEEAQSLRDSDAQALAAANLQVAELAQRRGATFVDVIESPWFWIGGSLLFIGGFLLGQRL
jgi:hypothetical protein